MPIVSTTYRIDGGPERRAQVAQPLNRPRRSTLRDRIARLHLDAVDPHLRASFDRMGAKVYARNASGPDVATFEVKL